MIIAPAAKRFHWSLAQVDFTKWTLWQSRFPRAQLRWMNWSSNWMPPTRAARSIRQIQRPVPGADLHRHRHLPGELLIIPTRIGTETMRRLQGSGVDEGPTAFWTCLEIASSLHSPASVRMNSTLRTQKLFIAKFYGLFSGSDRGSIMPRSDAALSGTLIRRRSRCGNGTPMPASSSACRTATAISLWIV